ncbi:MAG: TonB-dependent receptor [Candidatus Aminicenantales bacterium]
MRTSKVFLTILFSLILVSSLAAQGTLQDTGSIRGTVKDAEGNALPGVTITVTSPALMNSESVVTGVDGGFRISLLRIGSYTLTAELQGFQVAKREGLQVGVGATVTLNITMEQAALAEEISVTATAPVVDVKSSAMANSFKSDLIQNLPINRDLGTVVTLAPGVVSAQSVKGGTAANTIYNVDGLYANDPDNAQAGANVDFNIMEEVEVMSGGMDASVGLASGGFVSAVTRSGGNAFSGLLQAFYNREPWTTIVIPDDQRTAMGVGKPNVQVFSYDLSGSFGGPIIKDKLWFYVNGRYGKSETRSGFIPWTSPLGVTYEDFNRENWNWGAFGKLTYQPTRSLRLTVNGNYRAAYANTRASGIYMPFDCTYTDDPWANTNMFGSATYIINPNTYLEARVGWLQVSAFLMLPRKELDDVAHNYDYYTSYYFGTGDRTNEWIGRPTKQASLHLTKFMDNVLGGDHEFKAGLEYNTVACNWSNWQKNPLQHHWYNGNPYYYAAQGMDRDVYGDGRIALYVMATEREKGVAKSRGLRLSGYLQDSWTIKNRLTINAGLRYDNTRGSIPDLFKERTGGIAYSVGQATLLPASGLNPYDEFSQEGVNPFIKWATLTPRLGFTYDLFGDGKTALKMHIGRYSDWLYASLIVSYNPLRLSSYTFNWWDDNGNKVPDNAGIDHYQVISTRDPKVMLREYWSRLVNTNIKGTYDDQITLGIDHELVKNLKVSLQYTYKKKNNIIDDALYDFETGKTWYQPDSGYWVPFTTTVPARDQFPAQEVTMYFMKKDAPPMFNILTNVPEAYRKYSGVDVTFNKRYANGWQLGGSVTISKTWGNMPGGYGDIWGYSAAGNNANFFVNSDGRLSEDRPLVIKLFGTFQLPWGILSSFYYNMYSGTPFQRSVGVTVPTAWANANGIDLNRSSSYTINTETMGGRRNYTYQNMDFRLEKEFAKTKFGTLSAYLDVYNLFGNYYVNVTQNPGGTWKPTDNNVTTGTYAPSGSYKRITGISNLTRIFRISVRYAF